MTGRDRLQSRYGLRVPTPEGASATHLDLRPRRIQEWIRQLPLADAPESCRRIQSLLRASNRTRLATAVRYKLAETLHDTVGYVVRSLLSSAHHRGLPLAGRALLQVDLGTGLLSEYSQAYKLVVLDALAGGRAERRLLGYALLRAMQQSTRLLLDHYALYWPASEGLWLDLHQLYRIAEDHDLLTPAAQSRRAPPGARIAEMYREALLISLCNPYRLRRGELGRIVSFAASAAHKVILSPSPTRRTNFQVRTEQDRAPFAQAFACDAGTVRYIDLRAVVAALDQPQSQCGEVEPQLRQRLLSLWRRPPRRGFKRIAQLSQVRVGVGLQTAFHLLERDAPAAVEPAPGIVPPLHDSHLASADRWDARNDEDAFAAPSGHNGNEQYPLPGTSLPEPQYRDFLWRTLDVSAHGCCLLWESEGPSTARVGELVTLRESESGSWTIGVVRWMQYQRHQGLRLGVELLGPAAEAVVTHELSGPARRAPDPALELAPIRAAGQPASLILPATRHRTGDDLEVSARAVRKRVRLTAELERTGNFSHFVFEAIDPVDRRAPA